MNREQCETAIAESGLAHLQAKLRELLSPSVRLTGHPPSQAGSSAIPAGQSRFGGYPDLPPDVAWPAVDGIPLMFVAQVRLEELAGLPGADVLPQRGLLSFFFDGTLTGYEQGQPADRCRVLWYPETQDLRPCSPPDEVPPAFRLFESRELSASATWTLPSFEEVSAEEFPTIPALKPVIPRQDASTYEEFRGKLRTYETRLLGHPDELQGGELRFNAVLRRDEENRFRYEDYEWTNEESLVSEMSNLVLLLQSSRDPETGSDWGNGIVYFWIDAGDLAACRFERAFAVFQST